MAVECWAFGRGVLGLWPWSARPPAVGLLCLWPSIAMWVALKLRLSPHGYPRRQERVSIIAIGLFETPLPTDISKTMAANKMDTANDWRDM